MGSSHGLGVNRCRPAVPFAVFLFSCSAACLFFWPSSLTYPQTLAILRCGPCQFLLPILDELAARYEGRLRILKVDTESEPELASALAIRGLPTLCFVRDGALKYRMEGALAADELASIIDQILLDTPATEA
eukprot:TRINITY_DN2474_c0_g1_i5.p3 TRINITY_DN2474_c0_g1~~TRINITY_DN2474_c0_g1_i5.p3  ORF type:complete len:132 (-),score=29.91 TRINITY_DN2474_c0_g1_i5:577-972(-)